MPELNDEVLEKMIALEKGKTKSASSEYEEKSITVSTEVSQEYAIVLGMQKYETALLMVRGHSGRKTGVASRLYWIDNGVKKKLVADGHKNNGDNWDDFFQGDEVHYIYNNLK